MKSLVLVLAFAFASAQVRQPQILSLTNEINPDGSFSYAYQTEDGISAQAQGELKNAGRADLETQVIRGQFTYTAPDGVQYTVSYIADELGFHPQGAHLPRLPDAPLRSIDPKRITGEKIIQPRFGFP